MPDFPTDPREFDGDDRISFSQLDRTFLAVDDDGEEYVFDDTTRQWVLESDVGAEINAAEDPHSTRDDPAIGHIVSPTHSQASRKRKESYEKRSKNDPAKDDRTKKDHAKETNDSNSKNSNSKNSNNNNSNSNNKKPRVNTAVYVTGLPADATVDEINSLFSRKAGVIAEEIDSGRPRIKLYTDPETGACRGDALVVFFKAPSVAMAILLLDDTEFRPSPNGQGPRMHVQEADASYKKTDTTRGDEEAKQENHGIGGAKVRKGKGKGGVVDPHRQKIIKKTQKLESKLADWDDDDDDDGGGAADASSAARALASANARTVILTHMFTLAELADDAAALLDIKEDVRDECAKLGAVTSVTLYDAEPEGIVSVKFAEPSAAAACLRTMHGRCFGGQVVEAFLATGRERFRKSKAPDHELGEDGEDEDAASKDGRATKDSREA